MGPGAGPFDLRGQAEQQAVSPERTVVALDCGGGTFRGILYAGIIATNTTLSRSEIAGHALAGEAG